MAKSKQELTEQLRVFNCLNVGHLYKPKLTQITQIYDSYHLITMLKIYVIFHYAYFFKRTL